MTALGKTYRNRTPSYILQGKPTTKFARNLSLLLLLKLEINYLQKDTILHPDVFFKRSQDHYSEINQISLS